MQYTPLGGFWSPLSFQSVWFEQTWAIELAAEKSSKTHE